jgi:WXXGXW repeat (2 copies)
MRHFALLNLPEPFRTTRLLRNPALVTVCAASAVLLTSCAAQVRVAGPVVYVPPPPPAVVATGPEFVVRVRLAPPPLPVYEQPPCPIVGWIWTPGYWAWAAGGYYWVPGTWVAPPRVGVLWTPGYWGFVGGVYVWNAGYWGPHVGFYGGVNYGFGYTGVGFAGGRWVGGAFAYNRSVTNVTNVHVTNVYNETVINNVNVTRVSYNGGAGGTIATPTEDERMAARESHIQPTAIQRQHVQEAQRNPALFAKANAGHPPIAATLHPAAFNEPGVVHARGANPAFEPAAMRHDSARQPGTAQVQRPDRKPQHPNTARKPGKRRPDKDKRQDQ